MRKKKNKTKPGTPDGLEKTAALKYGPAFRARGEEKGNSGVGNPELVGKQEQAGLCKCVLERRKCVGTGTEGQKEP